MAFRHRWKPERWIVEERERRARANRRRMHTCGALSIHAEALWLRTLKARRRDDERRKRVDLPWLTATSADERAHIEVREERVAVHRAEWEIQGCVEEIGRIYDELPEGGR